MIDFDIIRADVMKWPCSQVKEIQMSLTKKTPLFDIEASGICNLECNFCPRSKIVRKNKFLEPEIFDILCNWLPDEAVVMFSGLGECLLNKNIGTYIQKLNERRISSCIITNGILLTPQKQKDLIESGIDQIQISYLTLDENRYNDLVGTGGDFKLLNYNLQNLSETKPANIRVQLNFLDIGINSNEFSTIEEKTLKWGFDFFYRREHSRGGSNLKKEFDSEINDTCFRCGTFPSVHLITTDGNITSCSNDTKSLNILGNITSLDFASIQQNKLKIMMDNSEFDVCKRCTDDYRWYTLWNRSYEKRI